MKNNELTALVEGAKRGDRAAFEKLYGEYYDRLYFFVLKNVGRKDAAEDITQETFLQSMESIKRLENPENYSSWLHGIAYHKCADLFRSERRSAYFETDEEQQSAMDNALLNEPIMLPEDYTVNEELSQELKKVIDELNPVMRSAVILYYYDNMSVSEVAGTLGISENAAKQKLFQARRKLKTKISKKYKGAALCVVPVGDIVRRTVSARYAAAARTAPAAIVAGGTAVKAVAASAAVIVAVGVPAGMGLFRGSGENSGDIRQMNESAYVRETTPDESSAAEKRLQELTESIADDTSSEAAVYEDDKQTPEKSDKPEAETVEMSVEKMLSMNGAELRALSDNKYELIPSASSQSAAYAVKCAAFPEYVFGLKRADGTENESEEIIKVPHEMLDGTTYTYEFTNEIEQLNLYEGAYVGGGVTVGMTYTEIEQALGTELSVRGIGSTLSLAAEVEIDGRNWLLHFDLTEEQKDQAFDRLAEQYEYEDYDGMQVLISESAVNARADLSELDPVCDIAVYIVQTQEEQ